MIVAMKWKYHKKRKIGWNDHGETIKNKKSPKGDRAAGAFAKNCSLFKYY